MTDISDRCGALPHLKAFHQDRQGLSATQLAEFGQAVASLPRKAPTLTTILHELLDRNALAELETLVPGVRQDPDTDASADLLFAMGLFYERTGRFQAGLDCLERAAALKDQVPMFHNNAGFFLEKLGRHAEAYDRYARAHALSPEASLHLLNLAKICVNHLDRFQEGMRYFNQALALNLEDTQTILHSANALHKFGRRQQAADRARLATRLNPTHIATVFAKLSYFLAVSYDSTAQLLEQRAALQQELDKVEHEVTVALATPGYAAKAFQLDGWQTLFLLAYQGMNDAAIMRRQSREISRALKPCFPRWVGLPAVAATRRREGERIRVGFCTAYFYLHSVWKIPLHGFYRHLDRSRFEIHSFHMAGVVDAVTQEVRQLSDHYARAETLDEMAGLLAKAELDVLVYPEFGMDVATFLLSVMRFAPVQCQALGHPVTSGSDVIDYVLSAERMEPPDGQAHYSEKLVRLPGLGVTYSYPYERHVGTKEAFGLASTDLVLFSPQSTFKYIPENDDLFPAIARRLGAVKFVLISPASPQVQEQFARRLRASFAAQGLDSSDFIHFIPGQATAGFMQACDMADLFIDNPSWSGHNTVLDALHSHTAVVAMRGDAMRKNHAAALLAHLGLDEYVAESLQEFIDKCVYYAGSTEARARFAARIGDLLPRLGDLAPVRALEGFMEKAVSEASAKAGR